MDSAQQLVWVRALYVTLLVTVAQLGGAGGQMAMYQNVSRMDNIHRTPIWYQNMGTMFNLPGGTVMNWHVHGTFSPDPEDSCQVVGTFHVSGRIFYAELVLAILPGRSHALSASCSNLDPYFSVTKINYYTYQRLLPRELHGRDIYKTPLPRDCRQQSGLLFYLVVKVRALNQEDCIPAFFRHISPWALVAGPMEK